MELPALIIKLRQTQLHHLNQLRDGLRIWAATMGINVDVSLDEVLLGRPIKLTISLFRPELGHLPGQTLVSTIQGFHLNENDTIYMHIRPMKILMPLGFGTAMETIGTLRLIQPEIAEWECLNLRQAEIMHVVIVRS